MHKHSDPEPLKTGTEPNGKVKEREPSKWLTTKGFLSADDGYEDSENPHVDVVHVAAICPKEDMHDLETFVASVRTERREFVFRLEMASLLVGVLTQESIERQAIRLLRGLTALREQDAPKKRAIIFVAYDLGALVVKMALSLAARSEEAYPGIFTNTAQFVFSGCPQRTPDSQAMELKLFAFLYAKRDDAWSRLLNTTSIRNLASSVLRTTEMFISSKITLRSRIISLYADEKTPGRIHPVRHFEILK
ncbi:MAG: hypothetical protein M1840_004988 [Geoglossum simile]|nr:MAG: hypothetical protein M1840_004988 [Geoglossum simile]